MISQALIHEILVEHSIQVDKRRISLRSQIDRGLPTTWVDPRRFNQVLSNLLSNALKFSGDGGDIEVGASRSNGNEVKAWVKDAGIGIASGEIGQIFEKYRQVSSGRSSGQKGTGLGLVIKKIVPRPMADGSGLKAKKEEAQRSFSPPVDALRSAPN